MYDELELINHLQIATGYNVYLAESKTLDIPTETLLENSPLVSVGHLGIHPENPEDFNANSMLELENSEILITNINILCNRQFLTVTRTKIKKGYQGFAPIQGNGDFGSISFIGAEVVGYSGDNVWWQEKVGLQIPSII